MTALHFIHTPEHQADGEHPTAQTLEQKALLALLGERTYAEIAADLKMNVRALYKLVTQKIYPMLRVRTRRELFEEALCRVPRTHLQHLCEQYRLTKKERLTFFLMVRKPRLKRGEIASQLSSSDATIRNHMHSIYRKMGLTGTSAKHRTTVIFRVYQTWQETQSAVDEG
jgi:DNA-binding CsgD family transcriptional regulator